MLLFAHSGNIIAGSRQPCVHNHLICTLTLDDVLPSPVKLLFWTHFFLCSKQYKKNTLSISWAMVLKLHLPFLYLLYI